MNEKSQLRNATVNIKSNGTIKTNVTTVSKMTARFPFEVIANIHHRRCAVLDRFTYTNLI